MIIPDSAPADDRLLLLSWSRGRDEVAFTEFVRRHLGMVQGAALRKTARPELAEEVASSVFALAARRAASLAEHPCAGAWLHRTAVLESSNALRRELKHLKTAAAMLTQPDTSPEPALPHAALPHLDDALNSLPEHDRRAVMLRFGEKLSYDQMAARMGKSADACQKQTSRALERLRSVLSRRVASVSITALAAGLASAFNTPASAAAGNVSAAAIAAAPKISFAAILSHIIHTMSTAKQIAAATGLVALLASVPLGLSYSEAASLRIQVAERPAATAPMPAAKAPTVKKPAPKAPGSRIQPGVGAEEADRTVAMLRKLRGRMLTSSQMFDIAREIMGLPLSHLPRALEAMADFTGLLPAGALRMAVFARWGELDPEAAVATVGTAKLDWMTAEAARHTIASGWMERDPQGMTEWLLANPNSPIAGALAGTVAMSVGQFDRETMQKLNGVVRPGYYPGKLELEFEMKAEDGDVAAVARRLLAKAPDDHRRDQLLSDAASYLARTDPKAALDFVLAHPDPRGKISEAALTHSIGEWAKVDMGAAAAWAWAWDHKGSGIDPSSQVWKHLGLKSDAEILEIVSRASDEDSRLRALGRTALECAAREPEKSLRLLSLLPDELRPEAMEGYGNIRAGESLIKASEWLYTLPAGPDKDAAIRGFAPVLAKTDAESAVIWAASIQEEAQRSELVRRLGSAWLQKSPDAARAWLEQNESLTAADRAAITAKP